MSDSLQPHPLQHARPPCPSPTPGVHSNSHPSSQWCHPAISSSVVPFSSCPQSFPVSGSFKWVNDIMISVHFQGTPFSIMVIQVYAPTSNTEEDEAERFYEDLQDLLELTPRKRCPFHYRGLEFKSRKSRNTWSNRQSWPWSTKWSRAKANRVLPKECTGHSKHSLPLE